MTTLSNDALAQAMRLPASLLADAVDRHDPDAVAELLEPMDRQELYALAVVLAAHVDIPLVDSKRNRHEVDHVLVQRVLTGDARLAAIATRAERELIVSLWRNGNRPLRDLEAITGWKPERYHSKAAGQVAA